MGASQRLGRGFHRLGLFLAAVPLLIGGGIAIGGAMNQADSAGREHQMVHQKVVCAHEYILSQDALIAQHQGRPAPARGGALRALIEQRGLSSPPTSDVTIAPKGGMPLDAQHPPLSQRPAKRGLLESIERFLHPPDDKRLSLKQIGCSSWEYDTVSYGEARNPPKFNWLSVFAPPAAFGLAITLALTLAVYGLVRAIGWVIGGFAAA